MLRNLETLKLASEAFKIKETKKPKYNGYDAYKSQLNGREMHDNQPYRSDAILRQREDPNSTKYQNFVIPKKSTSYLPPITHQSSRNHLQRNNTAETDDIYGTNKSAKTILKDNYYSD